MPDLTVSHQGFRAVTILVGVLLLLLVTADDSSIALASRLTGSPATYTRYPDFDDGVLG